MIENLKQVIRGDFSYVPNLSLPKQKLSVFISSTFTDTLKERNVLLEVILPELQEIGFRNGIFITFSDMRFGVKDENTLDNMTWIACAAEIKRCFVESDGLFFVSLQGNKYGYMPLPKYINENLFDERKSKWNNDIELLSIANRWYFLNKNSIPPQYELKNLEVLNDEDFWGTALDRLRKGLQDIAFDEENGDELFISRSVTEWETKLAFLLDSSRSFWMHRRFENDITLENDPKGLICDVNGDASKSMKLDNLLTFMHSVFQCKESSYLSLTIKDVSDYNDKLSLAYLSYINNWENSMRKVFKMEIEKIIQNRQLWYQNSSDLGISSQMLDEILHHCKMAYEKAKTFSGRELLIMHALTLIQENRNNSRNGSVANVRLSKIIEQQERQGIVGQCTDESIVSAYIGITLCLIGVSGSGKTSLMSMLATLLTSSTSSSVPVIIRFCGTSKYSTNGLSLVQSLCQQIACIYNIRESSSTSSTSHPVIKTTYEEAVACFHKYLAEYPIILFIDSLDQLSDANEARSRISFLSNCKPHPDSRIIISALPDEMDTMTGKWIYCYQCDTRLKRACVPRIQVEKFTVMSQGHEGNNEIASLLRDLLHQQSKVLQDHQFQYLLAQAAAEPTALYLSLAVSIAIKWTSYDSHLTLQSTVNGVINQIFDGLERDFGRQLTRYALGFISFSQTGINDIEMNDLLSLSDDVLTELFQYSKPDGIYRFSFHAWLRLRHAMSGLLVERSFNCCHWYHRQLIEASKARYTEGEISNLHRVLGIYFGNIVDADTRRSRLIARQPIVLSEIPVWFGGSLPNHRRCAESVYGLIYAGLYSDAAAELCDFDYICACCLVGEGFSLVDSISMLLSKMVGKLKDGEADFPSILVDRVSHYCRWLTQDMTLIVESPQTAITASASTQPLQSIVRIDIMAYYSRSLSREADPVISPPHKSLSANLDEWNDKSWIRATSLGGKRNFSPQLTNFKGHSNRVNCVRFSPDETRVVSCSDDKTIKIWDTTSGSVKQTLETGSSTSTTQSLAFSANGSEVISGSSDGVIRIWDATTGILLRTLEGHTDAINSLSTSADHSILVSGSSDTTIKIWDLSTGNLMGTLTGHSGAVISISFQSKRNKVVSGSADHTIRMWDLLPEVSNSSSVTLLGHSKAVTSVCFNSDGMRFASGCSDNSAMIWDCSDEHGSCLLLFTLLGHTEAITGICWLIDDSKVITTSDDKTLKLWNVFDGTLYCSIDEHVDSITCLNIGSSGAKLVTGSGILDTVVKVWDVTLLESFLKDEVWEGHSSYILTVVFSSDNTKLLSGSDDKLIKIWDVSTMTELLTLQGHTEAVMCACFGGEDSHLIASGSVDKNVIIWETDSGKLLHLCAGHTEELYAICFTPDGSKVISGSSDKNIKIWNSSSGILLRTLEGHTSYVFSVSVDIYCRKIVSGSYDDTIRIWDINIGEVLQVLTGHSKAVRSVMFSPDGSKILSGSDDTSIRIWDSTSGSLLLDWIAHDSIIMTVSFSKDGSRIISASVDSKIKIWDSTTGKLQHTLIGHSNAVISACFNNVGSRIASGSADRTIRLWEAISLT